MSTHGRYVYTWGLAVGDPGNPSDEPSPIVVIMRGDTIEEALASARSALWGIVSYAYTTEEFDALDEEQLKALEGAKVGVLKLAAVMGASCQSVREVKL